MQHGTRRRVLVHARAAGVWHISRTTSVQLHRQAPLVVRRVQMPVMPLSEGPAEVGVNRSAWGRLTSTKFLSGSGEDSTSWLWGEEASCRRH